MNRREFETQEHNFFGYIKNKIKRLGSHLINLQKLMHQSPAQLLQTYLDKRNISPQEFARMSGMPLTEVTGILDGELPVTELRANHLAAALDTKPEIWLTEIVPTS